MRKEEEVGRFVERGQLNKALFLAALVFDEEKLSELLRKGAFPKARDHHQRTPLHYACKGPCSFLFRFSFS